MREIDTETPVVWPAWCYSGEAAMEDATPQQASSPHQTQTTIHNNSNSIINNNRGKRKNVSPALISGSTPSSSISSSSLSSALNQSALSSIDKMLNDRMMAASAHNINNNNNNNSNNNNNNNIDNNNKKFCDNGNNVLNNNNNNNSSSNNNLFYEVIKQEDCLDLNVKMNGDLTNNINSNNNNSNNNSNSNLVKNERLSPSNNNNNNHNLNHFNTNGEQTSASRSRSATPSSYPGTPPQGLNSIELQNSLNMQQQTAGSQRSELPGRNYSDFMRSLAAKYNNQNDSSNAKNLFFDPRLNINQLKSATKETFPITPETKKQQQSTNAAAVAAVANAAQHLTNMSSLFSGLPFPPGVFTPPIIDMSSTQALITLARAAKEAEIQSILKGTNPSLLKRNSSSVNSSNSNLSPRNLSPNTQNHLGTPKIPNFQMNPGFSLANFHQQMSNISNSTATSPSNNHNTSNNNSSNNTLNDSNSSNNGIENLTTIPLDLSSSTPVSKRPRLDDVACRMTVSPVLSTKSNSSETKPYLGGGTSSSSQNQPHAAASPSPSLAGRRCQAQSEEINSWSVEQVCEFVSSIDICAEYVQNFRDQQIDGTGLPLLTEEHLTNSLGLKLGPALKLKSILAKKLGGPCPCVSCATTGLNNSSSCSNHSGGAVKKEYTTNSISSIVNHSPWPSCAESES